MSIFITEGLERTLAVHGDGGKFGAGFQEVAGEQIRRRGGGIIERLSHISPIDTMGRERAEREIGDCMWLCVCRRVAWVKPHRNNCLPWRRMAKFWYESQCSLSIPT